MLIVPQDGALALAEFLRRGIALAPSMALFINNYNPVITTGLGDLTEASFVGYSRKLLNGWAVAVSDGNHGAKLVHPAKFFFATGPSAPQTVYGWYAVQLDWASVLRLLWVERGSPNPTFGTGSAFLSITPVLDLRSVFG